MTTATKKAKPAGRQFRNYFDKKELRDATAPLSIPVLPSDLAAADAVRSGSVNDEERFKECLLAQACNRVFGGDAHVAVMRRTAWVSLPGEKYALRYWLAPDARAMVAGFDREQPVEVGTMVRFDVVPAAEQLERKRKSKKAWRKKNPQFQSGGGPRKTDKSNTKSDPLHGVIRNGSYVRL